jgi:pimeloyl-ACP methyl ester carboxylesterase
MTELEQRCAAGLSYIVCARNAGMPVVMMHGIGSNAQSFAPLLQALDSRHPTLAWDAPGYGGSQPLAIDWPDAGDYAAALNRLLAHLELSRCVVLGHSLGALIASRFALIAPRQVAALVLISPALGYGIEKGAVLPPAVADRLDELGRLGAQKFAAARAPRLLADPGGNPDALRAVERAMAAIRRPGYDQAARMLAGGRLLADAAKIQVPTAVLVGSQDTITPPANARRVCDALPGPSHRHVYREIATAGHAVCQEQPAEIARAIAEFVEAKAEIHA